MKSLIFEEQNRMKEFRWKEKQYSAGIKDVRNQTKAIKDRIIRDICKSN